jgi:hypothetical protein
VFAPLTFRDNRNFPDSERSSDMASKRPKKTQPIPDTSRADSGLPGGGAGRTDVTGKMPDNIRIDPNITEGHPGYEESGESAIRPPEQASENATRK